MRWYLRCLESDSITHFGCEFLTVLATFWRLLQVSASKPIPLVSRINMPLLITGGTGFVGRRFIEGSDESFIAAVSRNPVKAKKTLGSSVSEVISWNPSASPFEAPDVHFDKVVNLMGEPIAEGRWSAAKKKRIHDSRVLGTRNLVDGLLATGKPPSVFVSASAVGIYGDTGEVVVDESHSVDDIFAASVCQAWEEEANRLTRHGTRVVRLRIGIVLGDSGGAIEKMLPIFKLGLGGKLGSGNQWMAWVHVDDVIGMINWALTNPSVTGPVNVTAPNPVRNAEFTRTLAQAVNRPAFLPAPKFALRLVFGEFANSLFFSQRILPKVALEQGYEFKYPNLAEAIADVV